MKKRLIKEGFWTTLMGVGILTFCGVIIYQGKATALDLSGWFAFGCLLIRAKDTLIGLEPKNTDKVV